MHATSRQSSDVVLPTSAEDKLLDGWYHTLDFGNGMVSRGHFDHRAVVDRYGIPASLEGMTALDVATADGFFAFELERRGAKVVTIDVASLGDCDWLPRMRSRVPAHVLQSRTWGQRFKIAHSMLGSKVERVELSVYELTRERLGDFDLVFCGDLLLHLQNPLQALINIRAATRQLAVIETVIEPDLEKAFPDQPYLAFGVRDQEKEPGEQTTYWRFTTRALEDMMTYADFPALRRQPVFGLPPHDLPVTSVVGYVDPAAAPALDVRPPVRAVA
jgi:tRNA (mo5U34)-methyltransferase